MLTGRPKSFKASHFHKILFLKLNKIIRAPKDCMSLLISVTNVQWKYEKKIKLKMKFIFKGHKCIKNTNLLLLYKTETKKEWKQVS